jgi:hypothetical protein
MGDSTLVLYSLGGLFLVTYVIPSIIKSWVDRVKVSRTEHPHDVSSSSFFTAKRYPYRWTFWHVNILCRGG